MVSSTSLRLLRRGAVVEIDERLAVDLLRQDREVGADRVDVVGNGSGAEARKPISAKIVIGYPPSVEADAEPFGATP